MRVDIIVGTPGRVIDMTKRGHLELQRSKYSVWMRQIECWIWAFSRCHVDNFTSTKPKTDPSFQCNVPQEVLDASEELLNDPEQVFTGGTEIEVPEIDQKYIRVGRGNKLWALGRILLTMSDKTRYLSLPTQKGWQTC